jgi:hypothetical protein
MRHSGRRHLARLYFAQHLLQERGVVANVAEVYSLERYSRGLQAIIVTGDAILLHLSLKRIGLRAGLRARWQGDSQANNRNDKQPTRIKYVAKQSLRPYYNFILDLPRWASNIGGVNCGELDVKERS